MNSPLCGLRRRHLTRLIAGLALAFALIAVLPGTATAQSVRGTIDGTVLDSGTQKYLEGAEISIRGTGLHAVTERDGSFTINDVPAGTYELIVTYPGIDPVRVPVTIDEGRMVNVPIKVTTQVVTLDTFKVTGAKEGMSQAIALQKISINTKLIAAGDQFGDIAEGNAAEYLKFLPGVGVDYNANDARAISLRGMNTMFTNVTLDGNPLASASSGNLNRRFEFEQVSINNVETVEVYKTITPDLPGTSTGGTINMVTKSAFDREGSLLTYRAYVQADNSDLYWHKSEGWGQEKTRKILPGIDLNYAARLGQNWGVNLNYKNSQLYNDYPRSQYTWEYNPANGGLPSKPALTSWNLQNEQKDTRRQSLSGKVDYRIGPKTRVSVVGQWAFYDLLFTDRTTTINTGNLTALSSTASSSDYGNGFVQGLPGRGSVTFGTINRWKSGVTWDGSINLDHEFGNGGRITASPYWSQAYSKYRDSTGSWYSDAVMQRSNLTVRFNNVGAVAPSYTIIDNATGAPFDLRDASKFFVSQLRSRPQTGVDTRSGFAIDYKSPNLPIRTPLTIKAGLRYDLTTRNIENHVFNRTWAAATTAGAITGSQLSAVIDNGFINHPIGYGLPAYPFINPYAAFTQFGGMPTLPWTPASDTVAWFDDITRAAYVRFDLTPIRDLVVAGGVRFEDRKTSVENRLPTLTSIAKSEFKDSRVFPSIMLKYTLHQNVLVRLGASQSIGLPDYGNLLPGTPAVTQVDATTGARGRVTVFNPSIKPYKVTNYDAGVAYYFGKSGSIEFSVFRKDFTDYIVQTAQTLTPELVSQFGVNPASLQSPIDQYDLLQFYNIKEPGHYTGAEFAFVQNLTFLPKPFHTLGLQINGTVMSVDPIKTNAVFSQDPSLNAAVLHQVQKSMEVAAVKRSLNVELNWSVGKFGFNAVSNFTGYVLKSGSGTGQVSGSGAIVQKTVQYIDIDSTTGRRVKPQFYDELQYQAPRNVIDVRIDYKWNRHFTPYFQVRNILKRPIIITTPTVPFNHAEYGDPIYELGVRGSF